MLRLFFGMLRLLFVLILLQSMLLAQEEQGEASGETTPNDESPSESVEQSNSESSVEEANRASREEPDGASIRESQPELLSVPLFEDSPPADNGDSAEESVLDEASEEDVPVLGDESATPAPLPAGALDVEDVLAAERRALSTGDEETLFIINDDGSTNIILLDPVYDTRLERYYARTDDHIYWRTDALFFISIPFSFLWTLTLVGFLDDFSVLSALFEGERGQEVRADSFSYSHDTYPSGTADPIFIFTWVNLVVWPLAVALNDVIDRTSEPKKYDKTKESMRNNRFYRDLLQQPF